MTTDVDWEKIRREAIDVRPATPKRQPKKFKIDHWLDADAVRVVMSIIVIGLLYLNACFAEWGWPHLG